MWLRAGHSSGITHLFSNPQPYTQRTAVSVSDTGNLDIDSFWNDKLLYIVHFRRWPIATLLFLTESSKFTATSIDVSSQRTTRNQRASCQDRRFLILKMQFRRIWHRGDSSGGFGIFTQVEKQNDEVRTNSRTMPVPQKTIRTWILEPTTVSANKGEKWRKTPKSKIEKNPNKHTFHSVSFNYTYLQKPLRKEETNVNRIRESVCGGGRGVLIALMHCMMRSSLKNKR